MRVGVGCGFGLGRTLTSLLWKKMGFCGEGEILLVSICIITSWLILIDIIGTSSASEPENRIRYCSLQYPEVYSSPPKIRFEYDGRQFNTTFSTSRKSSARDNNIYLVCYANYPVHFRGGEEMLEKPLKLFTDNLETYCKNEEKLVIRTKPECVRYEVKTFLPVHHLDENVISAKCESFCNQVAVGTKISVRERRKVIFGNVNSYKLKDRGNVTFVPMLKDPKRNEENKSFAETMREAAVDVDLVQIYTSPVGAEGKVWNIKCTTSSDLTAKGAWLLLKLKDASDLHIANYSKEYRKAGIHTIRTQYDRPTSVDFFLCLFPRLNDFTWISKSDEINFENPMTYYECVLHFCAYFVCAFILFVGVCFGIHRWLHSDCLNHKDGGMSTTSARSSQPQLHQQKFPHRQWSSSIEDECPQEEVTGSTESSISSPNHDNQGQSQVVQIEKERHHYIREEDEESKNSYAEDVTRTNVCESNENVRF